MEPNAPFHGLPTVTLENQHLRVDVLRDAGPRIVRLMVARSDRNMLAEVPHAAEPTPFGPFHFRGGHRLWHAPEAAPRSYIPDDTGVEIEQQSNALKVGGPTEAPTGIRKTMQITLDSDRAALKVEHTLANEGLWTVELAPWALTMMPLGGVAVLPLSAPPENNDPLLPSQHLVAWSYTRWEDQRIGLYNDLLLIRGIAEEPPCKLGYLNHTGWVGYLHDDVFLCKRWDPQPHLPHPDRNCNAESYVKTEFVELETIGPLAPLKPGESVTHTETWEVYPGVASGQSIEEIRALIAKLGL